ncbi:MAG: Hint domain-containing protein, partial [Jatrophihabitantaceae bacterium]
VGGGLAPAATRTESAQPATPTMTTVGFGHSQASPEADPVFGLTSRTTSVGAAGDVSMIDATVTAPVTTKGHSAVQIGLGRLTGGVDLDYFFVQDTNNQPALVVPFTGSVNTQQPLANVDSNGQFTSGLTLDTKLYSLKGVSYIQHNSSQSINTQVTGNTSTNVVSWNYPYDPNDPPNAYTSLMYGALAAANDSLTAFYFAFGIPVANPVAPVFQFNVCSYDWPDQPSVYCKQILDLQFWWHCLAEGTLVTLADGSTLEIEKVDNTKRVRTGSGTGSLAVEATTRGLHHTVAPDHPVTGVYRLSTAGGHQLILTGGHPVATPAGLIRASDLEVGDEVLTADGVDEVAELALDDFDRVFANLKLIDHGDRARGLTTAVGTFVANGIVVGDFESLTQLHYNNTHTLEYMTARIPERYHTDYESTLAAIASDNVRYGGHF